MRYKHLFRAILIIALFGFGESIFAQNSKPSFTVSFDEAKKMAEAQTHLVLQSLRQQATSATRSIPNIAPRKLAKNLIIKNKRQTETDMYIFNYDGGGFVVLSADTRQVPVLAYSEKQSFITDSLLPGTKAWTQSVSDEIEDIRSQNRKAKGLAVAEWKWHRDYIKPRTKGVNLSRLTEDPGQTGSCYPNIPNREKLPMLWTLWGQGCGYNDSLTPCATSPYCQRFLTGCGPTAIAQVLRFWQLPLSYNWSNTGQYSWGSNGSCAETARLMRDVGQKAANSVYWCTFDWVWTATYPSNIIAAFQYYGYSATLSNYLGSSTDDLIMAELDNNRPVILVGYRDVFTGHIWVCHGYRQYNTACGSMVYYRMNWGWDGFDDGWFLNTNWNGFNMYQNVVLNIKPNFSS